MGIVVRYSRIRERRPERAPPLRSPKPPGTDGRRQGKSYAFAVLLLSAAFLGFAYFYRTHSPGEVDAIKASFTMCRDKDTRNCVIDGDTFRYKGNEVRIANLDAPEIFSLAATARWRDL
ncbi:hypothetical protein G5V57_12315 [Nordella sp. HKS 07]|uniref:hypothetical protein n=1 Tax=Nordella sp. HKS 07 TaxID=2712222 RepID=UPI0013E1D97D|nr:hypothetical protein [Nordella sp. HKS 07]QIG48437.1 hypothetical protein G5V57_12315 [Nordella sp. HKS 07]